MRATLLEKIPGGAGTYGFRDADRRGLVWSSAIMRKRSLGTILISLNLPVVPDEVTVGEVNVILMSETRPSTLGASEVCAAGQT